MIKSLGYQYNHAYLQTLYTVRSDVHVRGGIDRQSVWRPRLTINAASSDVIKQSIDFASDAATRTFLRRHHQLKPVDERQRRQTGRLQ